MRTRINLNLKRLTSICIALALLLSTIGISGTIAHAAENDFDEVTLALSSNVVDDDTIDLYLLDEVHYITLNDLCRLTRSTKSVDGHVISVTQGIWRAEFDAESKKFSDGYQMLDISVLEISNGDYAVPALLFLTYYKAMAFIENDILYCELPEYTAWEALDLDYGNSLVDIYELYGGEGNVELSLTIDILMDFIMGKNPTTEKYLKSAYYEALDVDIYSYDAVKQYVNGRNDALYNDLVAEETQNLLESLSKICGTGDTTNKITQEAMDLYILFHYTGQIRDFYHLAYNAMEIGDTTSVRCYADQIASVWREGEFQKSLVKNNAKTVEGVFFLLSSAVEAAQQVKYTHQENNLVYRVMGQENMNKLSLDAGDNEWYTVANVYKSTATSLQNSFVNILGDLQTVAINDLVSEAAGKIGVDTFMESAASKVTGIKGIKSASWKIGLEVGRGAVNLFSWIDSLAEPDSLVDILFTDVGAYETDRLALYLSELQQNVWWVLCNERERMYNNPDDVTAYQDYIYAQQLYCRTSIAMYENLMAMNDEFGSDKDYWQSLFQARIDMLAVCLYQLTTLQDDGVNACLPLDLATFVYDAERIDTLLQIKTYSKLEDIDVLKNLRTFNYGENGYLQSIDDEQFSEPGYLSNKGTVLIEMDSKGRMTKREPDISLEWDYEYVEYIYNDNDQLIRSDLYSGGPTEYYYDGRGNLIRQVVSSMGDTEDVEYFYDDGILFKSIMTRNSSWSETGPYTEETHYKVDGQGRIIEANNITRSQVTEYNYDYWPIVASTTTYERGTLNSGFQYNDCVGHSIFAESLDDMEFFTDDKGRLIKISGVKNRVPYTYDFVYEQSQGGIAVESYPYDHEEIADLIRAYYVDDWEDGWLLVIFRSECDGKAYYSLKFDPDDPDEYPEGLSMPVAEITVDMKTGELFSYYQSQTFLW